MDNISSSASLVSYSADDCIWEGRKGQHGPHLAARHFPEALTEHVQAGGVQRPDRLGQVSKGGRVAQVQSGAGVVGQDPWEHRPLGEVVEGAAGRQIAEEEVVAVADLARLPCPRHPLHPPTLRLQETLIC